ncbi:hypothetical protein [Paludibacter sp. 221]|uniref:hypothetical protein n=1 Tax=Paludibacter sp. 221 TaxID=2302939 RepID=UPI001940956A|nr:hypothetical protein [Paludibacter sp. 221]
MKTRPDLNTLAKEVYQANKQKGFHDKELSNEHFLMLVITELSEAVEADRKDKTLKSKSINVSKFQEQTKAFNDTAFKLYFEEHIKDTIEDELADAVIRLLDLAGLRGYKDLKDLLLVATVSEKKTFAENIFSICKDIVYYKYSEPERISCALLNIERLCQILSIDLWLHVELKLKYNQLRPIKHGKEY